MVLHNKFDLIRSPRIHFGESRFHIRILVITEEIRYSFTLIYVLIITNVCESIGKEKLMNDIINTHNLTKHYGNVHAVDRISISVGKGEIYGFLGLNGAGKTTTIRMLLGMIRPTSGESYIFGKRVDAGNYHLWANIGYLVETPYSYPELSVKENLKIACELRNLSDKRCIDNVMEKLKITQYADRKAKHLLFLISTKCSNFSNMF